MSDDDDKIEDTDLEDLLSDDDDFKDMLGEEDDLDSDLSDFDDDAGTMEDFTEDETSLVEDESLDLSEEKTSLEPAAEAPAEAPAEADAPPQEEAPTSEEAQPAAEEAPQEEAPAAEQAPVEQAPEEQAPAPQAAEATQSDANLETLDAISLTVSVELSRLQVPVKKVLEMRPGNVLDMEVPKQGFVDLVVSGKKVGQGELVKMGEVVGVRILEMGTKSF